MRGMDGLLWRPSVPNVLVLAALCFSQACSSEQRKDSYLTVSVAADPAVAELVARLRLELYAADAAAGAAPLQVLEHEVSDWEGGGVHLTLSSTHTSPVILVVGGLASEGTVVLIERKLETRFVPDQQRRVAVYLGAACLGISDCSGRDATCYPVASGDTEAGACGAVEPGTTEVYLPMADAGAQAVDAQAADAEDALAEDAEAEAGDGSVIPDGYVACGEGSCHPAYPCLESASGGYTCAGQMAEWPVPNPGPEGARRPSYATLADGGVTLDRVTGLFWQRTLPDTYAGCTGKKAVEGDRCSWQEARSYCAQLELDGRAWRLPGRVELLSTLDYSKFSFPRSPYTTDLSAFPLAADRYEQYWSASPAFGTAGAAPPVSGAAGAWLVSAAGYSQFDSTQIGQRVRCVASEYDGSGTPADRYVVDEVEDTVSDTRTMLVWERAVPQRSLTLDEAKARCAARGAGFRVPSAVELATIFDPLRELPGVSAPFKGASSAAYFWTADLGIDATSMIMWEAVAPLWPAGVLDKAPALAAERGFELGELLMLVRCVR